MRSAVIALLLGWLVVVLSGCVKSSDTNGAPPSAGGPSVSSAGSAGGASEASDAKIKEDLLAKIKADPVLSKEKIEVEVKDGQITLTGEVSTGAVKIQAEDLARSIAEGQMVNAERLMTKE